MNSKLFAVVVGVATGCAIVGAVGIFLWLIYAALNLVIGK